MPEDHQLLRTVRAFARTIATSFEIGPALYDLTDRVGDVIAVDGAGFSLADRDERLRFVTGSDERVLRIERAQVTTGEGPCRTAFLEGRVVPIADLAAEARWPTYRAAAEKEERRAVAGVPLWSEGQRLGALNLYRREPGSWHPADLDLGQLIADLGTAYLLAARIRRSSQRVTDQLQHALDSRIVIEQAKGVLAERHGMDTATAFGRLRAYARSENLRVHDVARGILDGTLDPGAPTDP